jgi:predicted DNA-binding transcriptional regulator AlpA
MYITRAVPGNRSAFINGFWSITMTEKAFLRATDICVLLSISLPCFYKWLQKGRFPKGIKLSPNCVAWKRETVEAWIAEREAASKTAAQ